MYELGFGNIYHPQTHGVTCRDVPRNLEYSNRKLVHHNHQGRRIKKQNGRLLLFKGVQIDGKKIKRPRCSFSIENKKERIVRRSEVSGDELHEECLPELPAWKGQIESLQMKSGGLESTIQEIKMLWKEWTREAAISYLQNTESSRQPILGRSSWRHTMSQNTEKISDQLRLNTKIIKMFFQKYRERCLMDCSFLLSETGRSVAELEKQLQDFVKHTKRILSFEWPMAVANLMLDEGASWIPLFVTSQSHTVFNAVAATMARLLYDVVMENIIRVKTFFSKDDRARLIIVLEEGEEEFDYWQKINVLLELCKIPRVDHKIYPRMFTEAWIDVTNWFDSEKIVFKPLPQPFEPVSVRISKVELMLVDYEKNPENVKFWESISKEILDIREQTLRKETRVLKNFLIYDSSEIKKKCMLRIGELEERVKAILMTHLSKRNSGIRSEFSKCSAKLFRNDVLVQLRNIEEVQNELPTIKENIHLIGAAYKVYMEYFTMPDYDIRQFYEISRLGMKLEQLVNFVWDRINHDRQWITKQVSEQTSKNYYECEMIEKEWLDCLKKYRSAVRINEVQKVQIKMGNLEERSRFLRGKDEKLVGQRSLLGLPSSPIDCNRIATVCEFFSKLTTLHFNILLHHESCLRMRISEVDHSFLVAETDRLQAEKDQMMEEAAAVNEHNTTSKEALLRMQSVLSEFEKLLPVLGAISCQAMKDRHWQQILQGTESTMKVEGNPLVSELLEMNFIEKADKFEQVGAQAEKERILETSIDKMREQWRSATFITHYHTGDLLSTELNVQMQAHLARSQTILSSPHAFSILDHIRHWLDTLLSLNTFVNLYKQCDARWRKIEGVFSTEDIAYQMPHEFRTFKKISLRWININNQISEERPILEQMDLVQQLNIDLSELEVLFGRMESGFHAYLRKKRAVFPRLFTLSDELVLSLICDSREPANCKSYLPLLFPALTTFDQNTKMEIVSVSTKTETLALVKSVNVNLSKRHVEKWMHELDIQIKHTLKTRIRQLIEKMNYKLSPVETVLGEPVQVAVMYLKIAFTWQMENSMKQSSLTILASELKICLRECQHAIIHKLPRREFLPPLYHVYKSASHLVNRFINDQVIFIDDYRWTSQLRYYWHMENVFIRVGTVSTRYEYEIQNIEFVLDQKTVDDAVKYFIFMNHFGFNIRTPKVDIHLARQIAGSLGRPFAICDSESEGDCRMIIEGSMLTGGVVYMLRNEVQDEIGSVTERDVFSSHSLSDLKFYFESEISINNSFIMLLTSSFQTARVIILEAASYSKVIDESFSLNSVAHREKKIQKFQIFTELENYTGKRNLWRNYLEATIAKTIEIEAVEQEAAIESIIFKSLSVSTTRKNRKLISQLLQIAESKPKKAATPKIPKSTETSTREPINPDPIYIREKTDELSNLLQNHQIVVVCGASCTGKSKIIDRAVRMKSIDLQIEFGLWEDMLAYGETLKHNRRLNKWIVIDGFMDSKTKQWLYRLGSEYTLFSWKELPIVASCERIIIETDTITDNLELLPTILLDVSEEILKITELENTELLRVDEVFKHFNEYKYRKLEVVKKIEGLKRCLSSGSERVIDYLIVTSMLTFSPLEKLEKYFFKTEEKLAEFFKSVPCSTGWYEMKEPAEIESAHFYIIHTICLILHSNFIPLLVSPPSEEFFGFLGRLRAELDELGWHPITMSIDRNSTIAEIKEFVGNCAIMFGGHEVSEVDDAPEGSNFFLIRGIEDASPEVMDWLRHKYEKKKIMKMLFVSPYTLETFHQRIQRYIFQINWTDLNRQPSTCFPLSKYNSAIHSLTKDVKIPEIINSIRNQLIDSMLDAKLLSLYENVAVLQTSSDYGIVRGKLFIEIPELCAIYKDVITSINDREKRIRVDPVTVSFADSKTINMIEKVVKIDYGNAIIVGNDTSKTTDALTIVTDLNEQLLVTNYSIKTVAEWEEQMARVLRDCLIDGKETVLGLTIDSADSEFRHAMVEDATCFCCYQMIPPRYLTRLMLSEFGEKHTLEGKGIWEMLESKLSALRVVIVLKSDDFSWFLNCHRMLLSMLILIWWGEPTKQEQEQELFDELVNSELFSKQQVEQLMKVMEDIVEMKMVSKRAEKLKTFQTIVKLARDMKKEVNKTMSKYEKGMEKMKRAEEQVAGMQGELLRLQPQLVRTSIETSMLMSTIEKETIDVENAREVVAANEFKANEAATKAQALKAESEAELASAIPALESAVEALETMTQSDVSSLKTMRFPPYAVRLCMEAVCILLGVKPAKITNEIGEVVNDYWVSGQKLLSDIHFLAKIRSFARDSISKKTVKLIREKYLSKEEFDPENVKQCSLAAEGLCRWVLAIDMYHQISKIVEPKRERLRKAEVLVKQHMKQLEVKRKALLKVTEKLQGLSDQFSQMCQKKQELESQIASCETRMERAERLVQALGGEKDKWQSKITDIVHEDSLSVPYSVGSTLALHVFGKLPIDEREKKIRSTMRTLFPRLEVTIRCDLKSLVFLGEEPICFVNDDGRALEFLKGAFENVVVANQWTENERKMCLAPKSVLLFEICDENERIAKELEDAKYYSQGEEELLIMKIGETHHEVIRSFRIFFRTQKPSTSLDRSIIIDNKSSIVELKREICEKMGTSNWFETLNHYNEMVESRNQDVSMMEKTENEMLELLGRSKDLDDERAIDLLAEARNLQASVVARNKEISEIEQSLREIEHKMSEPIEYSIKIVMMCRALENLDPFYKISQNVLVEVLQTKLFDNISTVNYSTISRTISELYWNFFNHMLYWDDKLIVHHLLFHNMNYNINKLEMEIRNHISSDSFHNLSSFILKSEPRKLILLKYDAEVYATLLQFGQITKNANWRVYSNLEHVLLKLEKLTDEPIWLLLNVNKSNQKTVNKMKEIMEKVQKLVVVHLSFRIILAYSNEIECSSEIISLSIHRFYFSAAASLAQQTRRIIANLSIRSFLDKSEESQRAQIIRLLCFHYGLVLRKKFDAEFEVVVDDADLLAMLRLYQQLRNLSDQPSEVQDLMKVKMDVIWPIYCSKTNNLVQLNVIVAMVQWIVEANLSIPADTLLRTIIKGDQKNFEDFAHYMQTRDDSILCGLNARNSKECRTALDRSLVQRMRILFEETKPSRVEPARKAIEAISWLANVEEGRRELDGREIRNLTEIVTVLKMKFYLKYKIGIAEVAISGEFVSENYDVNRKEFEEATMLKLNHCSLFSAQLLQGEIKECHTRKHLATCILLKTSKRTGPTNPRSLPLVCPTTRKPVAQIPFHSQFPIAHWQLRGVFATTGRTFEK